MPDTNTARGYPRYLNTDAPNGPAQHNALANAVDADVTTHENAKTGVHGLPAAGSWSAGQVPLWNGSGWTPTALAKSFRTVHTWAVAGEIRVPASFEDVIPPMFVSKLAGQTVKLVKARHMLQAGTSATVKVQRNGSDATGFTGISVGTEAETDPADITLADNDRLQLIVTSVTTTPSGAPRDMTFTLVFEHTI